ncbi:MAG: CPBP family intramembrane glutamic endopeptidase [Pseudomonadota bacterium]
MYSQPFAAFVAPAQRYPEIWRLIVGCLTGGATYVVCAIAMAAAGGVVLFLLGLSEDVRSIMEPDTPAKAGFLLSTFVAMWAAAWVAVKWHNRPFQTLFGPAATLRRNWLFSAGLSVAILAVSGSAAASFLGIETTQSRETFPWLLSLVWVLPLLFIQTTAEELIFRGYLQQQLAARFSSRVIWMGVPSLLFGLAHYNPDFGTDVALALVAATGLFGLVAADITRLTGNLGAAMGFHFANNFLALVVVTVAGNIDGLALFQTDFTMTERAIVLPLLLVDIAIILVVWGVLRRVFRP